MNDVTSADPTTVVVTGGCGYLGSQLIRDLAAGDTGRRPRLRVLDNLYSGRVEALFDLPAGDVTFVEGDILNPASLRRAFDGADAVLHLAANVRTPMSFDHPAAVEQVNHWGTANVVEACLGAGVRSLVFASSAAVYGPGGPFGEDDVPRPLGHYAQSKRRAELAVLAAADRGLDVRVLRVGSLYGVAPVMRFEAVVNRLVFLAGVGRALPVHGRGDQRRPAIHVRDASAALCHALTLEDGPVLLDAVAASPSVLEIAEAIQATRPDARVRYTEQDVLTHLSMEVHGEALRATGWTPAVSLVDGIAELLERLRLRAPATARSPFAEVADVD